MTTEQTPVVSPFLAKLQKQWSAGKFVCVGLDTDKTKIPNMRKKYPLLDKQKRASWWDIDCFNNDIVDATKDVAAAYKLNAAFYVTDDERLALCSAIAYIWASAPDALVILDAKRADIGPTNEGYVREAFDEFGADAVTVNPYFGEEALKPFLERTDKGVIVLCRTSNSGAREFQDRLVLVSREESINLGLKDSRYGSSKPLYEYVAYRVARHWNKHGNCALVVGATYPEELSAVREIAPRIPLLLPGFGKQGAKIAEAIPAARDPEGGGFLANSSSGIIYASNSIDFAEAAGREARRFHEEIHRCLQSQ